MLGQLHISIFVYLLVKIVMQGKLSQQLFFIYKNCISDCKTGNVGVTGTSQPVADKYTSRCTRSYKWVFSSHI